MDTKDQQVATVAPPGDWRNVLTLDDIRTELEALAEKEAAVDKELDDLYSQKLSIENNLSTLHKIMPNMNVIRNDIKQLTGMTSFTSDLAENVSSKVRQLDIAKSRILAVSLRVEDILDLKYCTEGVQTAMQGEDYEKAAALIHRFLSMDETILKMSADAAEGSSLNRSFTLLREAEQKMKNIAASKFDAAVTNGNEASVERFFKIFPLLGYKEEGLQKFVKYLSAKIASKAADSMKISLSMNSSDKRAQVIFSDLMESLFEHVAELIEHHQPLIETKYGHGWLFTFVKLIQKECDRQSRNILEEFKSMRKLNSIHKSVQDSSKPRTVPEEKYEPKNLDSLLAEITMMNSKAELYLRFLKRRITNDLEMLSSEAVADKQTEVDSLIRRCDLSLLMQELIGSYIRLEEYYMREMSSKAAQLDKHEEGSLTSSVVDDTFYIIKKTIRRSLTSSSIDGVCAVINNACSTLDETYISMLRSRIKLGYPSGALSQAYNYVQTSLQHGKLKSSDVEQARLDFLLTLNNSEVSGDNIRLLKSSIESELPRIHSHDNRHTDEKLDSCLTDLHHLTKRFKELLDMGFDSLRSTAIKTRIKPQVEIYLSTSHNINEEMFSQYEVEDPWIQAFIVDIDSFLKQFKPFLSTSNYDKLMSELAVELTSQLEKSTLKMSFNKLGGLQLDKELRSLLGYLTNITSWSIRDRFSRLKQMITILNLDQVSEILDYWGSNSGTYTWRLTPSEVRQVLMLRVDFSNDEIRKLKL